MHAKMEKTVIDRVSSIAHIRTCTCLSDGLIMFLFTSACPVALFTSANARWPSSSVTVPAKSWTQCCVYLHGMCTMNYTY